MPLAAHAAGLGRLTVASGLGEPLNAEIELLSTTEEELSTLTASIAPETTYAVQGLERTGVQNSIHIDVRKKTNGTPVLRLSSNQPVTDPFLDMLIQLDWATGRLLREYTLLLDPPGYNPPSSNSNLPSAFSTPSPATSVSPAPANAVQSGAVTGKGGRRGPASAAVKPETALEEAGAAGQTYATARGDTLSSIAKNVSMEGVSLDQMLVAIYRANKDAFVNGNMNRLKVGQILHIPSPQEVRGIPRGEAVQEIKVHSADWNAYRNRLAGAVNEAAAAAEEPGNQAASGRLTTAAEDRAAPPPAGPRDVVRLSKNDTTANAPSKSTQEKMNALQEETIAKEKALQEANDRISALEKQVQDMQKLLTIRNQMMADLQKNATPLQQSTTLAPAAESPAPSPEQQPNVAQPDVEQSTADQPKPERESETPSPALAPAPAAVTKPQPQALKKPVAAPEPGPETSILDNLPVDPVILGSALGGLLLLGGGWLFIRNKRRRNLDSFEKAILTSGGLKANTVFGNTLSTGPVDTGDTSFLTDFSPSGGMIDTHDVDPIAEAEVYMAYGRDAQAEEILRDAIAKEPKRYELHLKLLEMYANRKDIAAFEALAGELYSTLGTSDPHWLKVAELGRKLEPENPLYHVEAAPLAAVSGSESPLEETQKAFKESDLGNAAFMVTSGQDNDTGLDFSLDETPKAEATEAPVDDTMAALDFDFGGTLPTPPAEPSENPTVTAEPTTASLHIADEQAAGDDPKDTDASSLGVNTLEFPQMEPLAEQEDVTDPTVSEDNAGLEFRLDIPGQVSDETIQMDLDEFSRRLEMPEESNVKSSLKEAEPTREGDHPLDLHFGTSESSAISKWTEEGAEPAANTLELPEPEFLSDISFDLDTPASTSTLEDLPAIEESTAGADADTTVFPNPEATEEIVFESPKVGEDADLDFNLDADNFDQPLTAEIPDPPEDLKPPEVDLSDINLDLDEAHTAPAAPAFSPESAEVDTKLDLVTAYMDMGDNEGARELLEEILKEGGAQQRARAEVILKSLA